MFVTSGHMAYRGQALNAQVVHAQKKKSLVMAGEQLVQQYEASYRSDPAWLMEQRARPRLGLILAEMHALAHVGVSARQYSSRQLVLIAASGLTWQHVAPDGGDPDSESDAVTAESSGSISNSSSSSSSSGALSAVLSADDVLARAAGRSLVSVPLVDQVGARRRKLIRKLIPCAAYFNILFWLGPLHLHRLKDSSPETLDRHGLGKNKLKGVLLLSTPQHLKDLHLIIRNSEASDVARCVAPNQFSGMRVFPLLIRTILLL
jgi:hypothetical protein